MHLEKLESTGILNSLTAALGRNVAVSFYTDRYFNTTINNKFDAEKEKIFISCCKNLVSLGGYVSVINGAHSKLIMADDYLVSVGYFNWFSASKYQHKQLVSR